MRYSLLQSIRSNSNCLLRGSLCISSASPQLLRILLCLHPHQFPFFTAAFPSLPVGKDLHHRCPICRSLCAVVEAIYIFFSLRLFSCFCTLISSHSLSFPTVIPDTPINMRNASESGFLRYRNRMIHALSQLHYVLTRGLPLLIRPCSMSFTTFGSGFQSAYLLLPGARDSPCRPPSYHTAL